PACEAKGRGWEPHGPDSECLRHLAESPHDHRVRVCEHGQRHASVSGRSGPDQPPPWSAHPATHPRRRCSWAHRSLRFSSWAVVLPVGMWYSTFMPYYTPFDPNARGERRGRERWMLALLGLMVREATITAAWGLWLRGIVGPRLACWRASRPLARTMALIAAFVRWATGFLPPGSSAIRVADVDTGGYSTLAPNPLLSAGAAVQRAFDARFSGPAPVRKTMPLEQAVLVTQEVLGQGRAFPDLGDPLGRAVMATDELHSDRPANEFLLVIE